MVLRLSLAVRELNHREHKDHREEIGMVKHVRPWRIESSFSLRGLCVLRGLIARYFKIIAASIKPVND
jgi:hypothetical protein